MISATYFKTHPDKGRAFANKRRAMEAAVAINNLTEQDWRNILATFDHRCAYCGRKMQRLTMDHLTPISKGGNHTKSNIVPACRSCNSTKRAGPVLKSVQPLLL
jgi:5-methylcytosine-specific restriction endonuclease McrA